MTRPLLSARIGYAGYSADLSAPGDRRRFVAYARARGLQFERADLSRDYDVVFVTHNGDIPGWTARKRREGDRFKLIFELIDSYLTPTPIWRRLAKGAARRALGTDSRLSIDFGATLRDVLQVADSVICSTEEQAEGIRRWCSNVFVSFDDFSDEIGSTKSSFERTGKLRLVWEGQAATLRNLQSIAPVLNSLNDRIELHVVTDTFVHAHLGRFGRTEACELLRGIECEIRFHPWRRDSFARNVIDQDVAIIPIDLNDAFQRGKPENKLISFWKMGMPVVASASPAYHRAMGAAGIDLLCRGLADWHDRLGMLADLPANELAKFGKAGQNFAERCYSKQAFVTPFERAFAAAGFEA